MPMFYRSAQLPFDGEQTFGARRERIIRQHYLITATSLCKLNCGLGGGQQVVGSLARFVHRNTNTGGQDHIVGRFGQGRNRRSHALPQFFSLATVGQVDRHNEELIALQPEQHVGGPHRRRDLSSSLFDQTNRLDGSHHVHHALKPVKVDVNGGGTAWFCLRQRFFEDLQNLRTIGDDHAAADSFRGEHGDVVGASLGAGTDQNQIEQDLITVDGLQGSGSSPTLTGRGQR